jgi:hypothetical protein
MASNGGLRLCQPITTSWTQSLVVPGKQSSQYASAIYDARPHERQVSKYEFATRVVLISDTRESNDAGYCQQVGIGREQARRNADFKRVNAYTKPIGYFWIQVPNI